MPEKEKKSMTEITVSKRLTVRFAFWGVCLIVVQILLFVSIFMLWGAASVEKKQSYKQLKNTVAVRSSFLEKYFTNQQETVEYFQKNIEKIIDESSELYFNESGKESYGNRIYNERLISRTQDTIKELLTTSNAKGAFITLASESGSDFHQGIYLRLNENNIPELLVGDSACLEQMSINKADKWQQSFRITESGRCDYYNHIEETCHNIENIKEDKYGCLCPKYTLHGDNQEIITYTVPLLNADNTLYGVLGIELDLDKITSELPFTELSNGSDNMYYIAYEADGSDSLVSEIISANAGTDISDKNDILESTDSETASLICFENSGKNYIASVHALSFSGLEEGSQGGKWLLLGVVNKKSLLSDYYSNIMYTIVCFVAIILLAAVGFGYYIYMVSRKMKLFACQVKENNPQSEWHLDSTNIGELDLIGEVCKDLFERSLSYAKLAETIDMVNMPIGAIEYDENEEHVFCMDRAADILELHKSADGSQYMSRKHFELEYEALKKSVKPYGEEKDIFYMVSKTGANKYMKIKTLKYKNKWLVAVMDITEDILERKKIEYERDHDVLTHLLNRRAFKSRVAELIADNKVSVAAMVMFDLDNLKYFNDTYGHDYGDKYICAAATVLAKATSDNIMAARVSGDEFLLFAYNYADKEEIKTVIENLHKDLRESSIWLPNGESVKLRASAGISWYPDDADNIEELIRFADFAMYESKNNMKGTLNEFNKDNFKKNKVLFSGSEELNKLLDNPDNVKYAFHPIIDAKTGEIFAYEVLMRPQIEALRSPEDVMRLATVQSRLYDVEYMTWNEALRAVDRQRKPDDKFKLFINSVPNHELKSVDLQRIVDMYGHLLNRIVIEIIENEQADNHCMISKFKWAQKYGMSIALDDFGTGYSNESTLLFINPKYVKIDMSMIMGISVDENRQKIVQNLLSYTKSRDMKVIAEGIENYEDMATLISLGVDYMQGWYFMKPQFEIKDIDERFKFEIRECNKKLLSAASVDN